jgi:hypothetical protein
MVKQQRGDWLPTEEGLADCLRAKRQELTGYLAKKVKKRRLAITVGEVRR